LKQVFTVTLVDTEQAFVDRGVSNIQRFVSKKVEKSKLTQTQCDEILSRLNGTTDMEMAVEGVVMVVEPFSRNMRLSVTSFRSSMPCVPTTLFLASNTSTLNIASIAAITKDRTRVIGTHYFSPVPADAAG